MSDDVLVKARAKRRQGPYRGPTDAKVLNDTLDEVLADVTDISEAINVLHTRTKQMNLIYQREIEALKQRAAELEYQKTADDANQAVGGGEIIWSTNFRNLEGLDLSGTTLARRVRVEPSYGQVVCPANRAVNRFHAVNPTTNQIFLASGVQGTVTAVSESGASSVITGTPNNALNGNNTSFWIRQVYYPLDSDVDSVSCRFDVDVPHRFASNANMVYIRPHPLGSLDVDSILYSTSTADPSTSLPGFPAAGVEGAGALRYIFAPQAITKIRVQLTQRNWVEHDDMKLFITGLQELGVCLVEWDKTDETSLLSNNRFVWKIDCPSGYDFSTLTDFVSTPTYAVAGSDNGIHFKLFTDSTLSTEIWDSWSDDTIRATNINVAAGISSLYLVGVLKYQTSTQVTPVLTNLYLKYTVT